MHQHRVLNLILWTAIVLTLSSPGMIAAAEPNIAQASLARLKTLEGTWHGQANGGHEAPIPITHVFRLAAGGSVVMETMIAGSPEQEMINMYHLDGEDLVLQHYCSADNQPTMRLNLADPSSDEMRFDFAGGTNFDPAKDHHVHAARLVIVDQDTIESSWTGYDQGQAVGVRKFVLKRESTR